MPRREDSRNSRPADIPRRFDLPNGIAFILADYCSYRPPPIDALARILSYQLEDFKALRDEKHEQVYTAGPPRYDIARGGKGRDRFCTVCLLQRTADESGHYLSTDLWVKSITFAYTAATTLANIKENIEVYTQQSEGGGWVHEVVKLLRDKEHGELDAYEYMLARGPQS